MAEQAGDGETAAALDNNLSALYADLGELNLAVGYAERALERAQARGMRKHVARILIQLASLRSHQGRAAEAAEFFRQGLAQAERDGDQEMYAMAWNRMGEEYLLRHELDRAERALTEAFRVRMRLGSKGLETSYRNLGRLKVEQGDFRLGSALLDRAVELSHAPGGLLPSWNVYFARATARLAQGRAADALEDARKSVELVRLWRRNAPPDEFTQVSLDGVLQSVYSTRVEAAMRRYAETGISVFAEEAFQSAEENRAASLRDGLERFERDARPAEYGEAVARLAGAEASAFRHPGPATDQQLKRLRADLARWEATRPGLEWVSPVVDLRPGLQAQLTDKEAFISFHLRDPQSYAWVVTRNRLRAETIPGRAALAPLAAQFSRQVRTGLPEAAQTGRKLYESLLGGLAPEVTDKPEWLVSLDDELFEIPWPALVAGWKGATPVYLVEDHAIRIVSGATLLEGGGRRKAFAGGFLGIGDPVYNSADPRGGAPARLLRVSQDDLDLPRLAGSARELASCAALWKGRGATLLMGPEANVERVRRAVEGGPSVIHFATHVAEPESPRDDALIVLSRGPDGRQEMLTPLQVSRWSVSSDLVVLSGCSSGRAPVMAGAGLLGLTRAWLAAGAGAVIASRWPTPDDSGELFRILYSHLLRSGEGSPAEALRAAQVELLRGSGWRSGAAYWSTFFVIGNQVRK